MLTVGLRRRERGGPGRGQEPALLWCLGWRGATADLTLGFPVAGKVGTCACSCLNRRGLVLNLTPFVGSVSATVLDSTSLAVQKNTSLPLFKYFLEGRGK